LNWVAGKKVLRRGDLKPDALPAIGKRTGLIYGQKKVKNLIPGTAQGAIREGGATDISNV